ncbi:uncharacterized protein N0V89_007776 [Didymosphaeria variabile]|uniref:AB hydrolase-1 domain-containing protein n=1 Tax=Didymosphaeria variabile TaxID=1932322 RepID=A0A9W8XLS9_9PLEO|nr:uncharacterized protein N0V89_007776 [Didymosphaeria variabile]KAJ4352428.1 hypothetical protein N0V89_007776 [Didymosphaeria variabile]
MLINTKNEWEVADKSGLVDVGSYSLFVSARGPPRKPEAPVVIFITGGGAPTELYVHFHRAVSRYVRNYFYDRAGYGRSERPAVDANETTHILNHPQPCSVCAGGNAGWQTISSRSCTLCNDGDNSRKITAEDSAHELQQLMSAIGVKPPYMLVAHSYGGIIARTYLGLYPDDLAGMALLDTNSELLQQCLSPIPPVSFQKVTKDVDLEALTHLREESGMTDQEWDDAIAAIQRTRPAAADEATHYSGRQLARRMQIDDQAMGAKPLLVATSEMPQDWRKMLTEGMRLGGGSAQDRDDAVKWMESAELFCKQVQKVQLGLSSNSKYVHFEVGHDFPIRCPDQTAEAVRALLDMVSQQRS